ncbi:MAG: citrate synthase [Armatimonadota bacterium]|nr:citrate synthase [Armatimonadota bacterium]MDR5703131.1 citrate synthase [Armatimonadota bacterium]
MTQEPRSQVLAGLEGVVAATSTICFIDGKEGRLLYRGYDIADLAEKATFEEVCYLLWYGELPTGSQLQALREQLNASRALPEEILTLLRLFPKEAAPMDILRTAVSALGVIDPQASENSAEANLNKAIRLTAQIPAIIAAFDRIRRGEEPIPPREELAHAANFLYMLKGKESDPLSARAFDVALILHADHELNASTFSGRVTASTLSDMHSAVTSAIGTLKGPLHGGANEQVMKMLLEIATPERTEAYVMGMLAQKRRIPGFGHRVYRTEDPRAKFLRRLSRDLGEQAGELKWWEITRKVEEIAFREKGLYPNVDLYSASTYFYMGIPMDLFTPIFAISRISGWTAHILEQYADNRLIRPLSEYVGPTRREFIPLEQR